MPAIKRYTTTLLLAVGLVFLSVISLFVGVIDLDVPSLLSGNWDQWEIFLLSRLPRLLAILCTGVGMSVAGLIMQQLCMNKFVSPTTGATISSAKFGILLALLFMPNSTLWSRAIFAFVMATLGTWVFVWFIQRIQFKDVVMVPLVGIMFGNVIGGITNYLAYQYEMTQALSTWEVGHFSLVVQGRYELCTCRAHGDFGLPLRQPLQHCGHGEGLFPEPGGPLQPGALWRPDHRGDDYGFGGGCGGGHLLHRPYCTQRGAMFKGDRIRGTLVDTALFGAIFVLGCDVIARTVIAPMSCPSSWWWGSWGV